MTQDAGDAVGLKNIADLEWEPDFPTLGMIPIGYLRYYYQTATMLSEQKQSAEKKELVQKLCRKSNMNCLNL